MVLFAADYPFLDVFWTMLVFVMWVIWFWILISVIGDVFRRRDMSGWAKAAWTAFVIVLPFLGVLIYLIANSEGMAERAAKSAVAASGSGPASEIETGKRLLDSGAITDAEFAAIKSRAIA